MGELTFSALCLPYVAVVAALLVTSVICVVVRGDVVIRLALLTLCGAAIPWACAFIILCCTEDRALATLAVRVGTGPISLVGPGILMLILAVSGRFDSRRIVVALAFAAGTASMVICWSTTWVIEGVREIPAGMLFPTPGPMQLVHLAQIPLWGIAGMVISRRGMRGVRDDHARALRRRAIAVAVLAITTLADTLLDHGIVGVYPLAWLPSLLAIGIAIHSVLRADLLRARGIDHPALLELASLGLVVVFLYVVGWGGNETWNASPVVTGLFLGPLPMLGLVAAWMLRIRRRRAERASDTASTAIDRFAEEVRDLDDEAAVATALGALLAAHAPITETRAWLVDEAGTLSPLVPADGPSPKIDARVRAWMVANSEPLVVAELATARVGGLRALVEEVVEKLDADVVIPLVDRDMLIGVAVAALPAYRVLRDDERDFVRNASTTAARGLTFMALTREAAHLATTAREVELAEAVQHARATGDVTLGVGPWQVLGHYRPAARVAGDVWSCADLGDGKLLLFAGDVVGRGVPSAMVSAAVGGVCEAAPALTGGAIEPRALLELAHRTVRDLGGGTQRVTAFAAVLDRFNGKVKFASAGHRGAYVVRPGEGDERPRLDVLSARSTPLGEPTLIIGEGERPLHPDDLLVACSDGVVEVRSETGDPWGDRRLQRMLRDQLIGAGDRAARMIVAASIAHAGDTAVADDMLVVVVRPAPALGSIAP